MVQTVGQTRGKAAAKSQGLPFFFHLAPFLSPPPCAAAAETVYALCALLQIAVGILLKYDFELDATQMLFSGPTIALICLYVAGFAWSW